MKNDTEIIHSVRQGKQEAFADLVKRYQRKVYAIAWSRLGDADLAEDAAQETFLKAFTHLDALKHPEKFASWLGRIASNVSVNFLRKHKKELQSRHQWKLETEREKSDSSDGMPDSQQTLENTLSQTISELPPMHRETLTLFYVDGKSVKETAEILGLNESAVKTRLHRARKVLREEMENRLEEGLARLEPGKRFSNSVMAALPSLPWGAGGAGILGKMWSTFVFFLWITLGQVAVFGTVMSWFARMQADSFQERPENDFRKSILWRNTLTVIIMAVVVIAFAQWFSLKFGPVLLFQGLFVLTLWGLYESVRFLRINESLFAWGQIFTYGMMSLSFFLIGFLGAPFYVFLVAMLLINIVLYFTQKNMPRRMDYNLFVRGATGGISSREDSAENEAINLDQEKMEGFVRFLGSLFLVRDYKIKNGNLILLLPPSRNTLLNMLTMAKWSGSRLVMNGQGRCRAYMDQTDWKAIQSYNRRQLTKKELCEQVEQTVQQALGFFLKGSQEEAQQLLCRYKDEAVFKEEFGKSRQYKKMFIFVIVCSVVSLLCFLSVYWLSQR